MPTVTLKRGREKSLLRRHPWVFSGAIDTVRGNPAMGETVEVISHDGRFLARGAYSPESQIRIRVWTFDENGTVGPDFFRSRIQSAYKLRKDVFPVSPDAAFRVINAESDGFPGLIVDMYGGYLVCQIVSAGPERYREDITGILADTLQPSGIFERSDADVREKEGLAPRTGPISGEEPPDLIEIDEHGRRYLVDVRRGHKTGFYLDQRDNRSLLEKFTGEKDVLNCFSYTGGFCIAALRGGASTVVNIDSSGEALDLGRKNVELNGMDSSAVEDIHGDVFAVLRKFRDSRRDFDCIVLDPPKFVTSGSQLMSGCRGYKDINLLAFKLLRPGGILFTFSCSGLVDMALFQKVVADGALDAGRDARIIHTMSQAGDHPVLLAYPEGRYLKGLVCRID